jgi:tetrahydromethanopterin S-methyltransferase subunit B
MEAVADGLFFFGFLIGITIAALLQMRDKSTQMGRKHAFG